MLVCDECLSGILELGWGTPGKIMFIGQCPAASNTTGARGTSEFDKYFLSFLAEVPLNQSDFYFTNLVKVPVDIDVIDNETIKHYRQHLLDEIQAVKPTLIITLGRFAEYWLKGLCESVYLLHPGALRHNRTDPQVWINQLKNIIQCKHSKNSQKIMESSLS